ATAGTVRKNRYPLTGREIGRSVDESNESDEGAGGIGCAHPADVLQTGKGFAFEIRPCLFGTDAFVAEAEQRFMSAPRYSAEGHVVDVAAEMGVILSCF